MFCRNKTQNIAKVVYVPSDIFFWWISYQITKLFVIVDVKIETVNRYLKI